MVKESIYLSRLLKVLSIEIDEPLAIECDNRQTIRLLAESAKLQIDWPDRTVGLGPDRTGLILVRSGPKVKDRTVKQSPFLVRTGLKLL